MNANIQYYIENTIHSNYSSSLFFGKLVKVAETISKGVVKPSLLCLDGTNPRLLTYLTSTIKLPISSNSKDSDKVLFVRTYNDAILTSTHLFIYDPLGIIDEMKFNQIRNNVPHIYYLTNEKIFDRHYLNFLTEQNALYINQSIFVNRKYCYKASLLFENTAEAFLKLFNSSIINQKWYEKDGYIGLKEQNTEGTLLVYSFTEGPKKVGVFNVDSVEETEDTGLPVVQNNLLTEDSIYSLSEKLSRIEMLLSETNNNTLTHLEMLFDRKISEVLSNMQVENTYDEEGDPLAPFRI